MLISPYEISFGGSDNDEFEYDVLYPSCELVNDIMKVAPGETAFPCFQDVILKRSDVVDDLISAMDGYISKPEFGASTAKIEGSLGDLLRGRALNADSNGFSKSNCVAIATACELIRESQRTPIDLSIIADRVGLSRFYFIRLFHKFTRMTPSAYQRQVKLAAARRLILDGANLAAAAAEAGFADQAHMTRLFKQTFGFTPGQLMRGLRASDAQVSLH
jgi:AraC-like DNA-binding protein